MEHSFIELNDLPDEILLIILKDLHNVKVLYSLIDVNKRLNTIVKYLISTKYLTLRTFFSDGLLYRFTNTILDRFCLQILSKIHHKIEFLDLESSSMERILLSANYPSLHELGLYDLATKTPKDLFTKTLTHYHNITNNFPGGLFKCVRKVSLYDESPFEYEFFLQVVPSFPFMEKLTVHKSEITQE
ncbi:unnamed protein product [Rotaria sp. Silwood2]|nr:unnamed protein product [Rotaria sp. Silwood2]CAF3955807.1 unnamed protein product [Rotaria sp. Silwood2]